MLYHVTVGSRILAVELGPDGIRVDGTPVSVDFGRVADTAVRSLLLDGASHRIVARPAGGGVWDLHVRGRRMRAEVVDERTRVIREMTGRGAAPTGPAPVRAPMPGLVVRVEIGEGDVVAAGQGLVIVEAMKMENELKAGAAGRVTRVHVAPGATVEKDQVLVDLAPLDPQGAE